jgi:molecular chaperone GrpE
VSSDHRTDDNSGEEPRVVVRDRRRIDPETGQVRPATEAEKSEQPAQPVVPEGAAGSGPAAGSDPGLDAGTTSQEAELKAQLDERTADLQRLQAEYANYRKRIDRDREVVVNTAKAAVMQELLSVLDDVDRAKQHGDLTGAFKAVADKLVASLERVGLESFGHDGEEFDPSVHEAVQHDTSPTVAGPTVTAVLRRGYRFGDRVVRAALVGVTDHDPAGPAATGSSTVDAEAAGPAQPEAPADAETADLDWFSPAQVDTPADGAND